jgi:hypothetical protein
MIDFLFYLFVVLLLAAAVVIGAIFVRSYLTGTSPAAALFGPRPERRIDVVEHTNVDGRRKLLLIRRDDVEHLIMTGGPVDVVIETGIKDPGLSRPEAAAVPLTPVFARQPRAFGQAAGES